MKRRLARRLGDKPQPQQRGPEVVHPGFRAEPELPTDQTELRNLRRSGPAPVHLSFDLRREIAEQVAPVERGITALPRPAAMRGAVAEVIAAADTVTLIVAELISDSAGASPEARRRSAGVMAELAARAQSEEPAVTDSMITGGTWAADLLVRTEVLADDLAALLARAHRPGSPALGGDLSVAERVEQALRRLDRAVRDALALLDRVRAHQALPSPEEHNRQRRAEVAAERARQAQYESQRRAEARRMAAVGTGR